MFIRIVIFIVVAVLVVALGPSAQAEQPAGFFLGGGFNFQHMNGDGYVTTCFEPSGWVDDPFAVDAMDDFGWASRTLIGFRGSVGYRFSGPTDNDWAVTVSLCRYLRKKGGDEPFESYKDDLVYNVFSISETPILTQSVVYLASSRFDQMTTRISLSYYVNESFYVNVGLDYIWMKLGLNKFYYFDSNITGLLHVDATDDAIGYGLGAGSEMPLSPKLYLNGTFYYSFAHYTGNGFYGVGPFGETDIDIGGIELGFDLRYYIK